MAHALIDNVSADDTSDGLYISSSAEKGGQVERLISFFAIAATWSGGEAKLQVSPDDTNYFDVPETIVTTDTAVNVTIGGGLYVRAVFEDNSGSPSGVYVYISG